jgi:hypothetical protein
MDIPKENRRPCGAPELVAAQLKQLDVSPPASFVNFFAEHEGPFGSNRTSFELGSLCDDSGNDNDPHSIPALTRICRSVHGWPQHFLVLTNMVADSVMVYDTQRDLVFDVDFEGSDELLKAGTLEPTFDSFDAFLQWYFTR